MSHLEGYLSALAKYYLPFHLILYAAFVYRGTFLPSFITGSLNLPRTTRARAWLAAADCSGPRMSVIALGSTSRANNTDGTVTKSLEIALSEFGSVLTDDERKQLQQIKGVPDSSAALVFTARLDASNSTRRGKSIGARAYSMLQSIQQFSAIVDTFISANPGIAALIWGSIKLIILVSHPSRLEEVKRCLG
jgi:hypothetical protein